MKTKKEYKIRHEIYIFKFNISINTIKQHEVVYSNTIIQLYKHRNIFRWG